MSAEIANKFVIEQTSVSDCKKCFDFTLEFLKANWIVMLVVLLAIFVIMYKFYQWRFLKPYLPEVISVYVHTPEVVIQPAPVIEKPKEKPVEEKPKEKPVEEKPKA